MQIMQNVLFLLHVMNDLDNITENWPEQHMMHILASVYENTLL